MWELADTVPVNVRAYWTQRVVAAYEAELYDLAFEEAFRVIELATVTRSREAGGPRGNFSNAVDWLLARSIIKPRPGPLGDQWKTAPRGRNHTSHHQNVPDPNRMSRVMCETTFPTFVDMTNELWAPAGAPGR
jgi:hypothetical protein